MIKNLQNARLNFKYTGSTSINQKVLTGPMNGEESPAVREKYPSELKAASLGYYTLYRLTFNVQV